jgi:catechol 2,3-dioxygenase-like lactoylglutathione lyase family enzyme
VSLVEQWDRIERGLPEGWGDARLALSVEDEAKLARAAALLGPLTPGRRGSELRFFTARRGAGFGPDHLRRLLRGLDEERIPGTLELLASDAPAAAPAVERERLAESWDALVAALPDDWSDLYCELELTSGGHLERAALLLAPVNPARHGGTVGLRFRVARLRGYGASAEMTRRCLERLDEEGVTGRLEILRALSDTQHVATQGPVWRVGGRSV